MTTESLSKDVVLNALRNNNNMRLFTEAINSLPKQTGDMDFYVSWELFVRCGEWVNEYPDQLVLITSIASTGQFIYAEVVIDKNSGDYALLHIDCRHGWIYLPPSPLWSSEIKNQAKIDALNEPLKDRVWSRPSRRI